MKGMNKIHELNTLRLTDEEVKALEDLLKDTIEQLIEWEDGGTPELEYIENVLKKLEELK